MKPIMTSIIVVERTRTMPKIQIVKLICEQTQIPVGVSQEIGGLWYQSGCSGLKELPGRRLESREIKLGRHIEVTKALEEKLKRARAP